MRTREFKSGLVIGVGENYVKEKPPSKIARAGNGAYFASRKSKIRQGKVLGRKNCRK